MTSLTLNNGISMPQQGLGVFQIPDAAECRQSVLSALETGTASSTPQPATATSGPWERP